jgi:hypothetical protein
VPRFTRERITLLGFIYTTCVDPEGCPLAYRVFDALKQSIGVRPALRDQVQLVTLSFDPARDTPAAMQRYAGSRVKDDGSGVRWYFLTTRSARKLLPLVEGFGQDVRWTVDRSSGRPRRELAHVLKVRRGAPPPRGRRGSAASPGWSSNSTRALVNNGRNAPWISLLDWAPAGRAPGGRGPRVQPGAGFCGDAHST